MTVLHFALPSASVNPRLTRITSVWLGPGLCNRQCSYNLSPCCYVRQPSVHFYLFNVELVPPPVLADLTSSRVCHSAMLDAPSLRGWIRCVCYGERWLGVGSNEADWALELGCQLSQRQFDAPLCSRSSSLHDTLFSTPAPFHTSGTLKFSKYCRIPHLMLKKKTAQLKRDGRKGRGVSQAMTDDSLRISILIMITVSVFITVHILPWQYCTCIKVACGATAGSIWIHQWDLGNHRERLWLIQGSGDAR